MYGRAPPALSNTLSRVFAMLQMSFRWVASGFVPRPNPRKRALLGLTLLLAAGCGGAGGGSHPEHLVQGTSYRFSAPVGWAVTRSGREVQAARGIALVSVTRNSMRDLVTKHRGKLCLRFEEGE